MFHKNKSVFNMYAIYFLAMALFTVVRIVSSSGVWSGLDDGVATFLFPLIIQVGIMIVVPFGLHAILNRKKGGLKNTIASANIKPISFKAILFSVLLGIVLFLSTIILSALWGVLLQYLGYSTATTSSTTSSGLTAWVVLFINIVLVAILPAFGEELLHRGLLLNEISRIGYKKAMLISATLFALMHFNIEQVGYAFVAGLLLAFVVFATKSVVPAIVIHFVNNFLSIYLTSARTNGWLFGGALDTLNKIFFAGNNLLFSVLSAFVFLSLFAILALFLVFELFKHTTVKQVNEALNGVFEEKTQTKNMEVETHEKSKILQEMLLTKSNLNLNISKATNPIDIILPLNKNVFAPTKYDNVFLTASLVLGITVTIFTFVWGVL